MPRTIATEHTLTFLRGVLEKTEARILEVGCGLGHLAAALAAQGHKVIAIDSSPETVMQAKENGFNALLADILNFKSDQLFDVILFSRSLHHIHPLSSALQNAKSLLLPGGIVVAEEFSLEVMDTATAAWVYGAQNFVEKLAGTVSGDHRSAHKDLLMRWKEDHQHHDAPPLHHGKSMVEEFRKLFSKVSIETGPYLYRSFLADLERMEFGNEGMQALFEWEMQLIQTQFIRPIGLRISARNDSSVIR